MKSLLYYMMQKTILEPKQFRPENRFALFLELL